MVKVRVRQDDVANRGWGDREVLPVGEPQFLLALEEAGVNQDPAVAAGDQILRARD